MLKELQDTLGIGVLGDNQQHQDQKYWDEGGEEYSSGLSQPYVQLPLISLDQKAIWLTKYALGRN